MGTSFLWLVAAHIHRKYQDKTGELCIVLPNKRAALYLRQALAAEFGKTLWLPVMVTAEDFISEVSGLSELSEADLLCQLYKSYRHCHSESAEPFDAFTRWGQLILHDFNEIDRYLADPKRLYGNLRDIRELESWSLAGDQLTDHQAGYLKFMSSLEPVYAHFTSVLKQNGRAYAGLSSRVAAEKIQHAAYPGKFHRILFCGFNALTAAELKICKTLVESGKAEMLWDADRYYLDNKINEAGVFLRNNLRDFPAPHYFVGDHYSQKKEIEVVSVPRQMGQAQVLRQKLASLHRSGTDMRRVAVVLANERLLGQVLSQVPAEIATVNVTMGFPLNQSLAFDAIEHLLQIHLAYSRQSREKTIYHRDFVALFRQPVILTWLRASCPALNPSAPVREVTARNLSFLNRQRLGELLGTNLEALSNLLLPCEPILLPGRMREMLELCAGAIRSGRSEVADLELESMAMLIRQLNRLEEIIQSDGDFNSLTAFRQLFTQVTGNAGVSFSGEPLEGLQVMGLLETRCLDFDHVILLSANEGVLPAGKGANSFIPNDLKRAFGMPLYSDKDAVYAYHFYRLLQRAGDVMILCDSETDTFGKGERSRFVTQLAMELPAYNKSAIIRSLVAAYPELPLPGDDAVGLVRSPVSLAEIVQKATSAEKYGGLSPSGLAMYKDCALQFYFRYGAGLKESNEVEESAEAGTFGSILHLSLETLYKEFVGAEPTTSQLEGKCRDTEDAVREAFLFFFGGIAPAGKSLLQEDVIKVYVNKLIQRDIRFVKRLAERGDRLKILHLEQEFSAAILVPRDGTNVEVYVKGKIDRIDRHYGVTRVIDYKSSVKDSDRFVFESFDHLFTSRNYSKQMQLVIYAWLLYRNKVAPAAELSPCIIPFRVFSEEPRAILNADKSPMRFTDSFFAEFESALSQYVVRMTNEAGRFVQTDDEEVCSFCAYNMICNRGK
jgi:ATP-dependent helicase/nuclease subunit B